MDKHLHIVTHDVPWPADFGGVVDLFWKIKALHHQGIKIHLHCFKNNRPEQHTLHRFCASVNYYPRTKGAGALSLQVPYIVNSRNSRQLLENLSKDDYPILLEGIHCTYWLFKNKLAGRKVFVRLHNVEHQYYRHLALNEKSVLRKLYFRIESVLLKRYERKIAQSAVFIAVSEEDASFYRSAFNAPELKFLPVFVPWSQVKSETGSGNFCLYHGNLEISENEKAAEWLLENVFSEINIPFVIAGKNPSLTLQEKAHVQLHTCIVVNPSEHEMQDLIKKAQVNILPSMNNTGVKLKLLNALFNGRDCLVNNQAVSGSGLESLCVIADDAPAFRAQINRLYNEPFTAEKINKRSALLEQLYDNEKNANQLIEWLYSHYPRLSHSPS